MEESPPTAFAVIGRWTTDPGRSAAVEHVLRARVGPLLAARPGFVVGYWMRDPETGRAHTTVLWQSEAHARAFKAELDGLRRSAAIHGVTNDFLVVTDVLATAGPTPSGDLS